jgi:hypothetical protein
MGLEGSQMLCDGWTMSRNKGGGHRKERFTSLKEGRQSWLGTRLEDKGDYIPKKPGEEKD